MLNDLAYLVATRNELVHHFLQRFPLTDQDSCEQAIAHLETVQEMLKSHMKQLHGWDQARVIGMSALKDVLQSPQFRAWIKLAFMPRDHIDWPNARIVKELKRAESMLIKDGWTDLALAIDVIKNQNPDLTPKAHGCVSWRNLLHTSGLFDIRRERNPEATSITFFQEPVTPFSTGNSNLTRLLSSANRKDNSMLHSVIDHLSVWEVAHRWHSYDPNSTDPQVKHPSRRRR
ncbi:MAG: OST-HTH/LOTUS domain-containing protein [Marinobacter sp.]|nr:OST-HTH/LOTUS domain-containing protein [Marinobacter sp.]